MHLKTEQRKQAKVCKNSKSGISLTYKTAHDSFIQNNKAKVKIQCWKTRICYNSFNYS